MSSLPADLLEILVCPETHQKVAPATPELLRKIQALQQSGKLRNKAGKPVEETLMDALVREDQQVAYAVIDHFPIMLIDESIPLAQLA